MNKLDVMVVLIAVVALGAAIAGLGRDNVVAPSDVAASLAQQMSAVDGRLVDLQQQIDSLESLIRRTEVSGDPMTVTAPGQAAHHIAEFANRLSAIEGLIGSSMSPPEMMESASIGSQVLRDAMGRYRSLFLDRSKSVRVRVEALEMLGRFPEFKEALDQAVAQEVMVIVLDQSVDAVMARRTVLFCRQYESDQTTSTLLAAMTANHLSPSTRLAALIGLEGRRSASVVGALAGMRGNLGDPELEKEVERVVQGIPRAKHEKPSTKR